MATTDRFRTAPDPRYDVIVVGAGLGGLVTAALLATRGRRVLVVDQHYAAGGNATIFRRRGYEFDVGLHYIGGCHPSGSIPRILRAAGAAPVEFEELDPDGFDTMVFPGLRFRMPRGDEVLRRRLLETFPAEGRAIARFLDAIAQLRRLQRATTSPLAALGALPRCLGLVRRLGATYGAFLDEITDDVRLKAVLAGQYGDYAQPPSRAPLLLGLGLVQHYLDGAYFPRGGGQVLSDRLAEAIERAGSRVLLRARVRRILVERGRATGIELESPHLGVTRVAAPTIVSNADIKRTLLELVGPAHLRCATVAKTRDYEMSPALGILYLGIARDLRAEGHPRTNYWIYPSYDMEAPWRDVSAGRFADAPAVYATIATLKDPTNPRLAPPGVTNLQLMTVVPAMPEAWGVREEDVTSGAYRRSAAYRAHKEALARQLLDGAAAVIPGLRDRIVFQEVATPLTHRRFTGSSDGTSYGIALIRDQFLLRRPGPRTEIEGLYLCGASTRTNHGIGGVMLSGVMAAAAIAGRAVVRDVYGRENRRSAAEIASNVGSDIASHIGSKIASDTASAATDPAAPGKPVPRAESSTV